MYPNIQFTKSLNYKKDDDLYIKIIPANRDGMYYYIEDSPHDIEPPSVYTVAEILALDPDVTKEHLLALRNPSGTVLGEDRLDELLTAEEERDFLVNDQFPND